MSDHRSGPRRRGPELERAILDAVVAELAEVGYAALTIESVAARARAGKVSIYKRWPNKPALVVAAGYHVTSDAQVPPDTGSLRGDTFVWLRTMADLLGGPLGQALLGVVADTASGGDAGQLGALSQDRGQAIARTLVDRARARGERVREGLTPLQLSAPSNALKYLGLSQGTPVPDADLHRIVDELALPLWSPEPLGRQAEGG